MSSEIFAFHHLNAFLWLGMINVIPKRYSNSFCYLVTAQRSQHLRSYDLNMWNWISVPQNRPTYLSEIKDSYSSDSFSPHQECALEKNGIIQFHGVCLNEYKKKPEFNNMIFFLSKTGCIHTKSLEYWAHELRTIFNFKWFIWMALNSKNAHITKSWTL